MTKRPWTEEDAEKLATFLNPAMGKTQHGWTGARFCAELIEMLERLEWAAREEDVTGDVGAACPECEYLEVEGHGKGCELVALLTAANPSRKGGGQ